MFLNRYKSVVWPSVIIGVALFIINITLSKDLINYQQFFDMSHAGTWDELSGFSSENSVEYSYLLLNKLWPGDFATFLALIVYVGLSLKLIFFKWVEKVYKINVWYFVLTYIAFIGLVNDAAQLRIALASGFFMLAIVYYQEGSLPKHLVLVSIAALLHGSMVVLILAFHLHKFFRLLFNPWIFTLFFILGKLYLFDLSNEAMASLLEGYRYAHYFNIDDDLQNSTGLFQYFFGGLICMTFLYYQVLKSAKDNGVGLNRSDAACGFSDFCRHSGFMAIYLMLLFSQSIPMAVRFAELFLIFFMIDVLQYAKNYIHSTFFFNTIFAILVVVIGILRFYHTHIHLNPIFD